MSMPAGRQSVDHRVLLSRLAATRAELAAGSKSLQDPAHRGDLTRTVLRIEAELVDLRTKMLPAEDLDVVGGPLGEARAAFKRAVAETGEARAALARATRKVVAAKSAADRGDRLAALARVDRADVEKEVARAALATVMARLAEAKARCLDAPDVAGAEHAARDAWTLVGQSRC